MVVSAVLTALSVGASPAHRYLPADMTYDESIPAPHRILGYEVGSRQVTPEEQAAYLRHLAALSPRVQLETQGTTHEGRPQLLAVISSPENLGRIEEIRKRHLERATSGRPEGGVGGASPVVVWLAYSIHGNESSGANASLLVAYHLAAGQGPEMERLLKNAVILLDPCQNPDGLARFSQWVNSHKGRVPVADPRHRERVEPWPGARGNHYWFDLNRDWLLLQHPESRARVKTFLRWKPNLVTDFHEMWSSGTYFFQPGVPSRQGPFTPPRNLELTREIARYHADALDRAGRLYFSEEVFDDFYYGKGSSYPDISGSIGVLFEQASARGQRQKTVQGLLEFPFTIHNQVITSLSSLEAALDKREELLAYQSWFFAEARRESAVDPVKGYLCDGSPDPARRHLFVEVLLGHRIEVHELSQGGTRDQETSAGGLIVPTAQDQYWLVKALFTPIDQFEDTTFYDTSSWTLPMAFGLTCRELHSKDRELAALGARLASDSSPTGHFSNLDKNPYAYVFEWRHHFAPRALSRLLTSDIDARVWTEPFDAEHRFRPSPLSPRLEWSSPWGSSWNGQMRSPPDPGVGGPGRRFGGFCPLPASP